MLKRLVLNKEGKIKSFLLILLALSLIIVGIVYGADALLWVTPVTGENITGVYHFNASFANNDGLNSTWYWTNGSLVAASDAKWTMISTNNTNETTNANWFNMSNNTATMFGAADLFNISLNVTVSDDSDNYYEAVVHNINVDNNAPLLFNVSNGIANESTILTNYSEVGLSFIDFAYNVSDNFLVANCTLYIDGVHNVTATNPTNATTSNISILLRNGNYFYSINCTDYVNKMNSTPLGDKGFNFTVNLTASVTVTTDDADKAFVVSQSFINNVSFNVTVRNNGSITDTFTLNVNNSDNLNFAGLNISSFSLDSGAERNISLTVIHDNNVSTNATVEVWVNSSRSNNVSYAVLELHVNLTDVAPVFLNSTMPISGSIINATYYTSNTIMLNYTLDDLNMANCTLYDDFDGTWGENGYNSSSPNGTNQFNVTDVGDNSSSYNWSISCTDNSSQLITSANFSIKVDTLAPSLWVAAVYGVTADNTDNYTTKEIGFYFNASDGGGNVSNCALNLKTGPASAYAMNASVNFTYGNITNDTVFNFNFTLANGDYLWHINCSDAAGNVNQTTAWNLNVSEYGVNFTLPSGTPAQAINQSTEVNVNVTYTFTVTNNGTNTSIFTIGVNTTSGAQTADLNQTSVTLDPGAMANVTLSVTNTNSSNYTIELNATSDRHAPAYVTLRSYVNITDIAPIVTLTQGGFANNTFDPDGTVPYTVTVDDLNVANCTLYGDFNTTAQAENGTLTVAGLSQNGTALNFSDLVTLSNNATGYMWNVTCTDTSNNRGVSALYLTKVDTSRPNITAINATALHVTLYNGTDSQFNGSYFLSKSPINISVSVVGSNLDTVTLYYIAVNSSDTTVDEGDTAIAMTSSNGDSYNAQIPASAIPGYLTNVTFMIKINNSANITRYANRSDKNYTFKIDNRPPSPSLTATSSVDVGNAITISCTSTDQDSLTVPPNLTTYADVLDPSGTRSPDVGTSYTTSSTAGTGTVYCTATDLAGNNASISQIFTTVASGTGSGGGGSGSGAGTASVASESKTVSKFTAGTPASVTMVKSSDHGVSEVSVEVKNDVSWVTITVSKLEENPVSDAAGTNVLHYLTISSPKLTKANIEKAVVKFKVEKEWLSNNDLDKNTVALSRYSAGKWNKLTTRLLSEDSTSISYEADTPAFSFFAVTAEEKGATPDLEGVEGEVVEGEEEEEDVGVAPEEKAGKAGLVWLLVLLVLVVAGVLYYYYKKKK